MPQAVIFDIDGTLLDSVDLHAQAWQEAFKHFGYDIPFDKIRSQIGKGGDQLLPVFLSPEELKAKQKAIEEFRGNLFKQKYLPKVRPFPRVRELFRKIKDEGLGIALASSAKPGDVKRSKPHPDIFDAALDRLGPDVRREQVIVVGDSPHDAEGARRAKLSVIGVLCGGFPEATLGEAGCVAIYGGPEDLLKKYDSSPLAKQH